MLNYNQLTQKISGYFQSILPYHKHIYFGKSASTLLFQALLQINRETVILPGFICPNVSAMVQATGKKVVHIDVDPSSLHMRIDLLHKYLADYSSSEACLLVDHSFGYVDSTSQIMRSHYPDLLIIEDSVRALEAHGEEFPIGYCADIVLYSMYKTVIGNEHGGVLLSKQPMSFKQELGTYTSGREYASGVRVLRAFHAMVKRKRATLGSEPNIQRSVHFNPSSGRPSYLITYRFLRAIQGITKASQIRHLAWVDLEKKLSSDPRIKLIKTTTGTQPSRHYLSFIIPELTDPYSFVQSFNKAGYFLFNAWPDTPNYYKCFQGSYIFGFENTLYLAQNIIHIPIADFLRTKKRAKLIHYFENLLNTL